MKTPLQKIYDVYEKEGSKAALTLYESMTSEEKMAFQETLDDAVRAVVNLWHQIYEWIFELVKEEK